MTDGDSIQFIEIRVTVIEWLSHSDPLPQPELQALFEEFTNTVGEPATIESETRIQNKHMRTAPPEQFRAFANEHNAALLEADSAFTHAEIFGYPSTDTTWVPLLIGVSGSTAQARQTISETITELQGRFGKSLYF